MKKVFDQTVRDIKRGVNKKVLKVPGIEQKVLDATSNEPWGPHGSLLADVAQATRNYHEYQMIMTVIWKRINDTGKNWRHVYKALTVLEYLVAHGSERVIEEIREHAYQISTLSDFQYIDSSGRDQGSNVRKKSQSLVVLVNDKERIIELRQKAAANRDKFRTTSSSGGMYRPASYSSMGGYGEDRYDGRYGSKGEDRNGYGREREWGYRDDDRYSRDVDSYSRDGDRYGREYEEHYGKGGYRHDEYHGRSRSADKYQYGYRSRSADRDRDRTFDDDGQYSSRGSGARADDQSQDGSRQLDRKFSEQNLGAPPSYEEAASESHSPVHNGRDEETSATSAPKASSPPINHETTPTASAPGASSPTQEATAPAHVSVAVTSASFDEFDPRGLVSAAPAISNSAEMDLLGALSDSLAIVPSASASSEADAISGFTDTETQSTYNGTHQPFGDPFGDSPFKADSVQQTSASTETFQPTLNQSVQALSTEAITNFNFGDSFSKSNYLASSPSKVQHASTNSQYLLQELSSAQQNTDFRADILLPPGPLAIVAPSPAISYPSGQPVALQAFAASSQITQPNANHYGSFHSHSGSMAPVATNMAPLTPIVSYMAPQTPSGPAAQLNGGGNIVQQQSYAATQDNRDRLGSSYLQSGPSTLMASQQSLPSSTEPLPTIPQPSKDKFETKSTVWADTLSRGLVNLNISGPRINPLADIGIDFEAMSRKEKRMGKPAMASVTSNVTMGKAMGSGSGMGRAAASALRPPVNTMMSSNMGMDMGGRPGLGMGTGIGMGGRPGQGMGMGMGSGYGGMSQQMKMGMGMNMGMGQGFQMQRPTGLPPNSTMSGGYNPVMGTGGYPPQHPYGESYR